MSDDNITVRVLIEIRDEIRELRQDTNQRFDEVNKRLDQTDHRLDLTNHRLEAVHTGLREEMLASEARHATRLLALNAAAIDTNTMLRDRFDLRDRVERCEREIEQLKNKVG